MPTTTITISSEGPHLETLLGDTPAVLGASLELSGIYPGVVGLIRRLLTGFKARVGSTSVELARPQVIEPMLDPLSERELEIFRLLVRGMTPKQIAASLMISMNTTRTHLKRIYAKLNVHTREEAVEIGQRRVL